MWFVLLIIISDYESTSFDVAVPFPPSTVVVLFTNLKLPSFLPITTFYLFFLFFFFAFVNYTLPFSFLHILAYILLAYKPLPRQSAHENNSIQILLSILLFERLAANIRPTRSYTSLGILMWKYLAVWIKWRISIFHSATCGISTFLNWKVLWLWSP